MIGTFSSFGRRSSVEIRKTVDKVTDLDWSTQSYVFNHSPKKQAHSYQAAYREMPEEPVEGSCCGQGCTQCVWIKYGEAVLEKVIPSRAY